MPISLPYTYRVYFKTPTFRREFHRTVASYTKEHAIYLAMQADEVEFGKMDLEFIRFIKE